MNSRNPFKEPAGFFRGARVSRRASTPATPKCNRSAKRRRWKENAK